MALIHKFLTQVKATPLVDMDAYFQQLVQLIVEAHGVDTQKIRLVVARHGIQLTERLATRCGLIVNELATNSILHAFGQQGGTVEISLTEVGQGEYELVAWDDGCGMKTSEVRTNSMGLTLVETLVQSGLKGTFTISKPPGTRFVAKFKQPKE